MATLTPHPPKQAHSLVPVLFRDAVERIKHDGQYHVGVLLDQTHHILVVPKIQCPLGNLGGGNQTEIRS